jgi:hypothetical protein
VAVLSVDLAYKKYRDIGAVILEQEGAGAIRYDLLTIPLSGVPSSSDLAEWINKTCLARGIRILLLDGPQSWKSSINGLKHSRQCERGLNTPAKTGEPMSVRPSGYAPFVSFLISIFDALSSFGWERLTACGNELQPTVRVLVESFPLSAWRSLGIKHLPAKRRSRAADLESRLAWLAEVFPISLRGTLNHDPTSSVGRRPRGSSDRTRSVGLLLYCRTTARLRESLLARRPHRQPFEATHGNRSRLMAKTGKSTQRGSAFDASSPPNPSC